MKVVKAKIKLFQLSMEDDTGINLRDRKPEAIRRELDAKARPKRLTKQQAEELAAAEAEIKFEQDKLKNATTPGEKAVAQSKVKEKTKEVEAPACGRAVARPLRVMYEQVKRRFERCRRTPAPPP